MFILFHMTVPLLIFEIPLVKEKYKVNRLALLIGALISDIIDKPILLLGLGSGRGFSHSLLFVIIRTSIAFLMQNFYNKRKSNNNYIIPISYLIGLSFHLVLDLPEIPLFYPFISYPYLIRENIIEVWLNSLFTNPIVLSTELIGIIAIIFIIFKNKLYSIRKIWTYLSINQ